MENRVKKPIKVLSWVGGWVDGWTDECKSHFKGCLQQSKTGLCMFIQNNKNNPSSHNLTMCNKIEA